jgi:hypothetical protein
MKNKRSGKEPRTAWEYINWLEKSGRITFEEHSYLSHLLSKLEAEALDFGRND